MRNSFFRVKEYLNFFFESRTLKTLHSPFLFELFSYCLSGSSRIDEIENQRKSLLKEKISFLRTDLGASAQSGKKMTVSKIASVSLKSPHHASFQAKMAHHLECKHILELGTCFGISTAYLSKWNPEADVTSLEGDPFLLKRSGSLLESLKCYNVKLIEGDFSKSLPSYLNNDLQIDMAVLDGNHAYGPTLEYYQFIKTHLHEGSVVVVDDIYWSSEMKLAWKELIQRDEVMISVDCFYFGLLFFRKKQPKQNLKVRIDLF